MVRSASEKFFSMAIFLIGIVILVEVAATIFVLMSTNVGDLYIAGWLYALVKAIVGLFSITVGYTYRKN